MRLIVMLSIEPEVASRVARRWAGRLMALQWDDHPVDPVVEAVSHHCVSWTAGLLGTPTSARRWARSASSLLDDEVGPEGLPSAVWVRAMRMLGAGVGV